MSYQSRKVSDSENFVLQWLHTGDKRACAVLFKSSVFSKKLVKSWVVLRFCWQLGALSTRVTFCPSSGQRVIRDTLCPLSRSLVEHTRKHENTLPQEIGKLFENRTLIFFVLLLISENLCNGFSNQIFSRFVGISCRLQKNGFGTFFSKKIFIYNRKMRQKRRL